MIHLLTLRSFMSLGGALGCVWHIQKGFEAIGEPTRIYKFATRTAKVPRSYQDHFEYWNITPADFMQAIGNDKVFVFEAKCDGGSNMDYFHFGLDLLSRQRIWLLVHDIFDANQPELSAALRDCKGVGAICYRPVVAEVTGATEVPMPYHRSTSIRQPWATRKHACFASRISNEKRFLLAVAANRGLPEDKRIDFLGQANSLHTYHALKKYPEILPLLRQKGYKLGQGVSLMNGYKFHVDMTKYKTEVSFVQFITMESIEAGCVPVLDYVSARTSELGLAKACCLCNNAEGIVAALNTTRNHRVLWPIYDEILENHSAEKFARWFMQLPTMPR